MQDSDRLPTPRSVFGDRGRRHYVDVARRLTSSTGIEYDLSFADP